MWRFLNEPWDADVKGVWLRAVSMAYDTYALSHYTPISSLSLDVFVKLNNPGIKEKAEISGISNSANSLNGHLVFGAEEEDRQGRKWSNVAQDEVTDKFESFDCTSASYDEIDLEVSLDAKHRGCCGISLRCVDEEEDNEDEDNNGNDHYACLRQRASTTDSPRTEERRGETGSQQQQQRCSSSSSSSSNSTNTDTDQNEIGGNTLILVIDDAYINCSSRFDLEKLQMVSQILQFH
uniref:Uncharacterized protein n=1 Tax=Vespula pensylvanica TaxID=30213 RepID=A0A834PCB7_VESPE|nr:hypothetical protein H0235_003681 [Vespula pensylvanica]